jgi:hypothetical protein
VDCNVREGMSHLSCTNPVFSCARLGWMWRGFVESRKLAGLGATIHLRVTISGICVRRLISTAFAESAYAAGK